MSTELRCKILKALGIIEVLHIIGNGQVAYRCKDNFNALLLWRFHITLKYLKSKRSRCSKHSNQLTH